MKNFSILLSLFLAIFSCNGNAQNKLKRYDLKSGIIQYSTIINGKALGSTITGSGRESLYFKDWGAVELKEAMLSQTTVMKLMGNTNTETEKSHTMAKLDNRASYAVDFNKKQIYVSEDLAMDMIMTHQAEADAGKVGESMLESMGGRKTGTDQFQGYPCDIWEIMGGKQWIHKGLMLKMEMTVLGITTKTEATDIKLDVLIPDDHFDLPDFPVQETDQSKNSDDLQFDSKDMENGMEMMQNLSFEQWKQMVKQGDPEMKNTSDEELRQSYDMMQKTLKLRK